MHADKERARIAELKRLAIMDTAEESAYDDIVRTAASLCGTPVALITLLDDQRQWFKARIGTQVTETPKELAFCTHAIETPDRTFVVNDASKDHRFATNPLVTDEPKIRFYASAPLLTSNGHALGTVCVIDMAPREISTDQLEQLQFLAQQVVKMIEERVPSHP